MEEGERCEWVDGPGPEMFECSCFDGVYVGKGDGREA